MHTQMHISRKELQGEREREEQESQIDDPIRMERKALSKFN